MSVGTAALHARAVLADCEAAFLELQNANQENLRRRWFTMLALLRAVGHVLKGVDRGTSQAHRAVIDTKWEEVNAQKKAGEPAILWGFIEQERNNVLKSYQFAVRGNLTIGIPASSSGRMTDPDGSTYAPESRFNVWPLIGGPFVGEDPVKVVQQSIDFWRAYLDDIERAVA
jgi:hypothetical protein